MIDALSPSLASDESLDCRRIRSSHEQLSNIPLSIDDKFLEPDIGASHTRGQSSQHWSASLCVRRGLPSHVLRTGKGWIVGGGITLKRLFESTGIELVSETQSQNLSGWMIEQIGRTPQGG